MRDYARVEYKKSTAEGYEGVIRQYLRPRFAAKRLDEIKRDDLKEMINELIGKDLSRNTIRNALCVVRGMFSQAIEGGLIESNPAARLGRFTRTAKTPDTRGIALTQDEAQQFLEAANAVCPEYYPLFLAALRAGLRRGELVALHWGIFNSVRAKTIRTDSSWCSITTCDASTRLQRATSYAGWTCLESCELCSSASGTRGS